MQIKKRCSRKLPFGKQIQGSASGPTTNLWGNPAICTPTRRSIQDLFRATPGSARLDLSSAIYTVITSEMGKQALPTEIYGPLPKDSVGLLVEKGSSTIQGILMAPEVIDADFEGEIKMMVHLKDTRIGCSPLGDPDTQEPRSVRTGCKSKRYFYFGSAIG